MKARQHRHSWAAVLRISAALVEPQWCRLSKAVSDPTPSAACLSLSRSRSLSLSLSLSVGLPGV